MGEDSLEYWQLAAVVVYCARSCGGRKILCFHKIVHSARTIALGDYRSGTTCRLTDAKVGGGKWGKKVGKKSPQFPNIEFIYLKYLKY